MKTLALGGLGLTAGAGANNFDPYSLLPMVSIASIAGTIALVRMYPVKATSSPWFTQNCVAQPGGEEPSVPYPMCQAITVLQKNGLGTNDNLLPWKEEFGTDGIKDSDMSKVVMWGTAQESGLPFIATQYTTADKVQKCVAVFFPPSVYNMECYVSPPNCRQLGLPLDPRTLDPNLFGQTFEAFFQGKPLQNGDVVLQLALPAPASEEPTAGGASDPVQEEQLLPTPEPQAAGGASGSTSGNQQTKPTHEPQTAGGASGSTSGSQQTKPTHEPQTAGGASGPTSGNQQPGPTSAPNAAGGVQDPDLDQQQADQESGANPASGVALRVPVQQQSGLVSTTTVTREVPIIVTPQQSNQGHRGYTVIGNPIAQVSGQQHPKPTSGEQAAGGSAIRVPVTQQADSAPATLVTRRASNPVPVQPQSTQPPTTTGVQGKGTSLLIRDGLQLNSSAFTNKE